MSFSPELKYIYFLTRIRSLGNVRIKNLINSIGSPDKIFNLKRNDLHEIEGINQKISTEILDSCNSFSGFENEFNIIQEKCLKGDIKLISFLDKNYPENLNKIFNAPVLLYYKGELSSIDKFSVSVVGTRHPSSYGKMACEKFVKELSDMKLPVISGFARGIDSLAHKIAFSNKNLTYAIFGSGVDVIYPSENKKLYDSIIGNGAVISEFDLGSKPDAVNFPSRNRIISGISIATIIIECGLKSGTLITANIALDQNKEVFAVPGPINSRFSEGTNELIKNGTAKLVSKIDDVLIELENKLKYYDYNSKSESVKENISDLNESEKKIFKVLDHQAVNINKINELSGLSISECLVNLLSLEIKGLIKQVSGKNFIKL